MKSLYTSLVNVRRRWPRRCLPWSLVALESKANKEAICVRVDVDPSHSRQAVAASRRALVAGSLRSHCRPRAAFISPPLLFERHSSHIKTYTNNTSRRIPRRTHILSYQNFIKVFRPAAAASRSATCGWREARVTASVRLASVRRVSVRRASVRRARYSLARYPRNSNSEIFALRDSNSA